MDFLLLLYSYYMQDLNWQFCCWNWSYLMLGVQINTIWKVVMHIAYRFCWLPSHCGIERNEIVDQLAKETLDHDIDPLTTAHYANLKPLVNSYIQQVKIKWDVSIHGRDLYLLKPTLGPPERFRHLTRAEEVVITWLWIGHTKATKSHTKAIISHILPRGPPTAYQHCDHSDHWTHTPRMYSVAAKSWWVLA